MDWEFVVLIGIAALTIFGWGFAGYVVFTQSERAVRRRREMEDSAMRQATVRNPLDIVA